MVKKTNKTEDFMEQARADGRVTTLNRPEDLEAIRKMNEALEEFRQKRPRPDTEGHKRIYGG